MTFTVKCSSVPSLKFISLGVLKLLLISKSNKRDGVGKRKIKSITENIYVSVHILFRSGAPL